MQKLLSIEDITRLLGIGRTTTYKLVRKMKHIKIGRHILVAEDDLMDYINKNFEKQ